MNDEPIITMNLTDAEARALLCLIEVGAKEIRHRRDSGKYEHQCQRDIADGVLTRADAMHAGILRVLDRRNVQ